MAEDIKRVIEVDATSSSKTIRELREEIEKLKKTLSELTAGTKEFSDAQARMSQAQEEVNQAMEITAKDEDAQVKSMQELRAIIDENTGSFGFLVARMQELKVGIDATNARIKQITKDYDEGRMAVDDYNQELQENLEELQKLRTEQGDVRSSLNASTKALLSAKGSYVEMSQTLGQLRNAYRQLSKEQRDGAVGTEMLGQIKLLDAELKEVDASMGNFQRNVGGYEEALKQVLPPQAGLIVDLGKLSVEGGGIPSLFTGMKNSIVGMTKAAIAFIATPLGAMLTALAAAGAAAFALFNARNKEIEKQAEASAEALEKQKQQMERFDVEISREVELLRADGKEQEANALARRSVTDAMNKAQQAVDEYREKYNQMSAKEQKANAETLKGYEDALQARIDAWEEVIHEDEVRRRTELREEREQSEKLKEEWAKAAAEKQRIAEETNAAIREANAAFRDETALMQAEQGAGTQSGDLALAQEQFRQELAAFEAMVDEKQITEELAQERRKVMLEQYGQEIADIQAKYLKQQNVQLLKALDEEMAAEFKADKNRVSQELKNSKERKKIADAEYKHKQMITQQTGALLQAGAQLAGESTAVGKAMAVAATTISTYQAAQAAYQSAFMPVPTYASPVLGAINMAAAIATGLANIKSILSVDSSGGTGYGSASSTGATVSTPAIVTPPAVVQEVETVRSLTGASEEERLNQMASDQRVYLVYSDVEQAGKRVQVQQSETSF
jgi:DNA repair exonuclease SbcCD ATPase subunit